LLPQCAATSIRAMNLSGQTALVTGGARRVGRAMTEALARAGANVVVNYNHSGAEADDLVAQLSAEGMRATAFQADVSRSADIAALIQHVRETFAALDIVVNSASLFESAPFAEITEADWRRVIDVNLTGPFLLSQAALPLLHASSRANIINIVDLSALQPWPSYAHHSVSKAGLVQLTKVMARALGPRIRVNAIAPGTVLPPNGYDGTAGDGTSDRRLVTPAGTPDDVVRALFYLIESNFVTGQVLVVDGGRMLM
jgi:NAD(P)-dependent dehydrogenase (short-subunit alcohol dehydrogenase family)